MSALPVYHPHPTPPFQNPGSAPAWGPIKVTIPSSYRWKYAPLWLINHPRRLELDSLFLPWYRQPNHTLYIVFSGGSRGADPGMITPPWTCPDTENLCKVCVTGTDHPPPPLGMWMMSHGHCPRGGACECPRVGVFFNFPEGGWRHADNVQGGGGGACECLHPPPPGNPVSAPV